MFIGLSGECCFSTEKYLEAEERAIRARLEKSSGRLYMEVGGKLVADFHAARTLPGYDPRAKLTLLSRLKNDLDIIYCVSAMHLVGGKLREDFGMSYADVALATLDTFQSEGFARPQVAINLYNGQKEAKQFAQRLENRGYQVYFRHEIDDYPNNLEVILSARGYGQDPYIPVEKPLVVVTGPGGNSGKLSTCLGQLYHEYQQGLASGFAKIETFPVWNLAVTHPVNVAYEAATADLGDYNLIDPFHAEAYNEEAVNYNRDVESFPILQSILEGISSGKNSKLTYASPTEMGINELKQGITDDDLARQAAEQEIIFYHFRYREEYLNGHCDKQTLERMEDLLAKAGLEPTDRVVVTPAREAAEQAGKQEDKGSEGAYCGAALELPNGKIVTGKNSPLMHAESAVLLNGLKTLANIPDEINLLPEVIIHSIKGFKGDVLREPAPNLDAMEVLTALSIGKMTSPLAARALEQADQLRGCAMHTTHSLGEGNAKAIRKLGIWCTTDGQVVPKPLF